LNLRHRPAKLGIAFLHGLGSSCIHGRCVLELRIWSAFMNSIKNHPFLRGILPAHLDFIVQLAQQAQSRANQLFLGYDVMRRVAQIAIGPLQAMRENM
jgi:hypothetical protein